MPRSNRMAASRFFLRAMRERKTIRAAPRPFDRPHGACAPPATARAAGRSLACGNTRSRATTIREPAASAAAPNAARISRASCSLLACQITPRHNPEALANRRYALFFERFSASAPGEKSPRGATITGTPPSRPTLRATSVLRLVRAKKPLRQTTPGRSSPIRRARLSGRMRPEGR